MCSSIYRKGNIKRTDFRTEFGIGFSVTAVWEWQNLCRASAHFAMSPLNSWVPPKSRAPAASAAGSCIALMPFSDRAQGSCFGDGERAACRAHAPKNVPI